MQRIEARDARNQEASIVQHDPVGIGKSTIVDVRHHEAAEHEKHVNREVALTDQLGVVRNVQIRKTLHAIMIKYDPKRREPTKRRQGRQLTSRGARLCLRIRTFVVINNHCGDRALAMQKMHPPRPNDPIAHRFRSRGASSGIEERRVVNRLPKLRPCRQRPERCCSRET